MKAIILDIDGVLNNSIGPLYLLGWIPYFAIVLIFLGFVYAFFLFCNRGHNTNYEERDRIGYVCTSCYVNGIDTSMFQVSDILWLSSNGSVKSSERSKHE